MRAIAVIPARGGSKGIPGKNLAKVGGTSLVGRAVRTCRAAGLETWVTSDAESILAEARRWGAHSIRRPTDLASDAATSERTLLHALSQIRPAPEILVFVQCTSPFLRPGDVRGVVQAIVNGADTSFTAARSHSFLWQVSEEGARGVNHDKSKRPRRQEREAQFLETGGAYAMRVDGFLQEKHRFFGHTAIVEVPHATAVEIDEPADLDMARRLAPGAAAPDPAGRIDAVVFDFDGVMTDDGVWTDQEGRESVRCARGDGLGLERLKRASVPAFILSKEENPVVAARCRKLGVPCLQGQDDKGPVLARWIEGAGYDPDRVVYVGNDLNDLDPMAVVGHPVAVADAHPDVQAAAEWITSTPGGYGAVREVCEWVLRHERP